MVDVSTIKPGQKLRYIGEDGSVLVLGKNTMIRKGTEYSVKNDGTPFYSHYLGATYVSILVAPSATCLVNVNRLEYIDINADAAPPESTPSSCVCDIIALMSRGCRCGHIQREREAAR
jgi:hypothetical protein